MWTNSKFVGPVFMACMLIVWMEQSNGYTPKRSQPDALVEPLVLTENCGDEFWLGNSTERRTWNYRGLNEWNGQDYWCISPGNSCNLWDWWTHYPGAENDPCTEINTVDWGQQRVEAEAAASDTTLPSSFRIVSFSSSFPE